MIIDGQRQTVTCYDIIHTLLMLNSWLLNKVRFIGSILFFDNFNNSKRPEPIIDGQGLSMTCDDVITLAGGG